MSKFVLATCSALLLSSLSNAAIANKQESELCPESFFDVPVFDNAKLCQAYSESLPASMSYHAVAKPEETAQFYVNRFGQPENSMQQKGRTILRYNGDKKIIIISEDGEGSQVDMLIKAPS